MMNFQFPEHLFSTTALKVREQPFTVVLPKIVLKNFIKFTAKYLYRILYFKKVVSSRPAT